MRSQRPFQKFHKFGSTPLAFIHTLLRSSKEAEYCNRWERRSRSGPLFQEEPWINSGMSGSCVGSSFGSCKDETR